MLAGVRNAEPCLGLASLQVAAHRRCQLHAIPASRRTCTPAHIAPAGPHLFNNLHAGFGLDNVGARSRQGSHVDTHIIAHCLGVNPVQQQQQPVVDNGCVRCNEPAHAASMPLLSAHSALIQMLNAQHTLLRLPLHLQMWAGTPVEPQCVATQALHDLQFVQAMLNPGWNAAPTGLSDEQASQSQHFLVRCLQWLGWHILSYIRSSNERSVVVHCECTDENAKRHLQMVHLIPLLSKAAEQAHVAHVMPSCQSHHAVQPHAYVIRMPGYPTARTAQHL
jgi:hypothetical protein